MNICIVGAGYVGLVTALGLAHKGNKVFCIDRSKKKIEKLKKGIPTIYEEGLKDLLKQCLKDNNIYFTNDLGEGVRKSKVVFIAVGTPPKPDGDVDLSQLNDAIKQISNYINSYKVIVNKSTVPVGTQKYVNRVLLENKIPKEKFDVVSNPEFLREGKAVSDFLYPNRIVIGYDSNKAKKIMEELYKPFNSKIIYTNPETAELIKYASNAFLATKISFINEVANLCSKVGADIETVAYAMGLDNRISPKFLKAGIGFGGSCFPKDTEALIKIGEKNGCDFKIVRSAIEVNRTQRILPVRSILKHFSSVKNKTIGILGLSFKPGTDDIREAPALYIIRELIKEGANIKCYDPVVSIEINNIFPDIIIADNIYDCLKDSDCAVICTEWDEFKELDLNKVKKIMRNPLIIDGRNILDLERVKKSGISYQAIGRSIQ
jgi:UDPglucose 6-dehydrogenase